MADESLDGRVGADPHEIRRVNWREIFGFTNIFKSFRLSRHMSKLVIAVLAVVLTWGWGNLLDVVFRPFSGIHIGQADNQPITAPEAYWSQANFEQWRRDAREGVRGELMRMAQGEQLVGENRPFASADVLRERAENRPDEVRSELRRAYENRLASQVRSAEERLKQARERADQAREEDRAEQREQAERQHRREVQQANQGYVLALRGLALLGPQDPFNTFVAYQSHYFRQAVKATIRGHILTGFDTIRQARQQQLQFREIVPAGQLQAGQLPTGQVDDPIGLLASLALMGYGVIWLFAEHWFFAIVFFLPVLFLWSVAGGAMARAAALQATRDEKAGLRECVNFGVRKVVSFLASPLVPIIVFLVVGFLTAILPAMLGWIPWVGPVWIGLTFGVVLIVAVLLALLVIGLLAGGLLMWPTVAVEGSDTFDACTRSYQFVMARPWRAALYGLIAAVYGAILYLFVRFVLYLVLLIAHWIVSILTFGSGQMVREGASHWELIWPRPTYWNWYPGDVLPGGLLRGPDSVLFTGGDWFGAWLIWLWVALVGAVLVAWVVSYIVSASTMIYLLLRRAEDSTDLKEVYVEEPEEEVAETGEQAVTTETPVAETSTPPAPPAPAAPAAPAVPPAETAEPDAGETPPGPGEQAPPPQEPKQ